MKPEIKARFTDEMLSVIAGRYDVQTKALQALDGFESFIYRYEINAKGRILRIGHSARRNEALVRGEMDWLKHLAAGGAAVCGPELSMRGNPVEQISDHHGESFVAAAFEEAAGQSPWDQGWSDALHESYGQAIGRMHRLTSFYTPSDAGGFRPHWQDPEINDVAENLSGLDPIAFEKWQRLIDGCLALPQTPVSYGLVHFDAHGGNCFVDSDGRFMFFDFDDCNYNWFAADIAIVLFYRVMWEKDMPAATESFMRLFLKGYRSEYDLDPAWLETIPLFLKMREIDLYALIHRDFDVETMDDPWNLGFMDGRRDQIHADRPFVDFDFSILA